MKNLRKPSSIMPLVLGMMASLPGDQPAKIPSHKIELKKEEGQLSKQKLQRMKGKKTRENRGKNRRKNDL